LGVIPEITIPSTLIFLETSSPDRYSAAFAAGSSPPPFLLKFKALM
jgi:hypothetical protein